jgi:putative membrane protein
MKILISGLLSSMVLAQAASAAQQQTTPADFVAKASESGMAEVELGKLAAQKGSTAEVRAYGQRMVTDHSRAGVELDQLAAKKALPATKALSPAHAKVLEDLRAKSGKDFDAAYARQMVADHNEAVALFTAASALSDEDFAGFASRTLPTLRDHQQQAGHLDGKH